MRHGVASPQAKDRLGAQPRKGRENAGETPRNAKTRQQRAFAQPRGSGTQKVTRSASCSAVILAPFAAGGVKAWDYLG